jgi:hypothetical protein
MRVLLTLCLAMLAGCAQLAPGSSPSPSPSPTESESPAMDPTPSPRRSIDPSLAPPGGRPGVEIEVTGRLGADSIEGGCTYLEADDGTRYQVIYPDGWQISAAPLELRDPSEDVVATGGETITVRGREATDMLSICQIGPMFVASEVVSIDGD